MVGVATLLTRLYKDVGRVTDLQISDQGTHWQLTSDHAPLTVAELQQLTPFPILHFLATERERAKLPHSSFVPFFDYTAEQDQRKAYIEALNFVPVVYRRPGASFASDDPDLQSQLETIHAKQPDRRLILFEAINQTKITPSYNDLVWRWHALGQYPEVFCKVMGLLLRLYSVTPHPYLALANEFRTLHMQAHLGSLDATLLQIVNPTTGKGLNSVKLGSVAPGALTGFWLIEFLKFAGFFEVALPQRIQNNNDRKTYVVRVNNLSYSQLVRITRRFQRVVWSNSSMKLDVIAVLWLAKVVIEDYRDALIDKSITSHCDGLHPILNIVSGLDIVFYKSLGSAVVTMNIAFLALPAWLFIADTDRAIEEGIADTPQCKEILIEHLEIIGQFDERYGEDASLLHYYRDFLSSRDPNLTAFFYFMHNYTVYIMRAFEKHNYPLIFSTHNLEILMNERDKYAAKHVPLAPLLREKGFRSIARAIRESTITAQYRVAHYGDRRYDVHYGLGRDLVRSLISREMFVVALTDFIYRYNAETARVVTKVVKEQREGSKSQRWYVETAHLEEVIAAIDRYGYKLVGNLLLAYGYSFDSDTRQNKVDSTVLPSDHHDEV